MILRNDAVQSGTGCLALFRSAMVLIEICDIG